MKSENVPAEPRLHRLPCRRALGDGFEAGLDFGNQLAAPDLAERPVLLRRRATRVRPRRCAERGRIVGDVFDDAARAFVGDGPRSFVRSFRLDQNVRGLEQLGRPEAMDVCLIVAAAFGLSWLRRDDLLLEKGANDRILLYLRSAGFVRQAFGGNTRPGGLLKQQLADCQRSRGLDPSRFGVWRRVMLDLLGDRLRSDFDPVDAYFRKGRRRSRMSSSSSASAAAPDRPD